jgi:formylglycine-generating enzyme required for sulfatase activity/predicted RNA-binding Zn-ribbon protein involved in translation (DUF1610 family)
MTSDFISLNCPSCGGNLEFAANTKALECLNCGRRFILRGNLENGNSEITHTEKPGNTEQPVNENKAKRQRGRFSVELAPEIFMEFVRVPAGEFFMGSKTRDKANEAYDNTPRHIVFLDEYFIGKYLVTNQQYLVVAQKSGLRLPAHWKLGQFPAGKQDHPVYNVTWKDASFFCKWISQKIGMQVCLPTEAQWENAARDTDERTFPWGEGINMSYANYNGYFGGTTEVGKFSPQGDSPYGCADMAGNVWEWVENSYYLYPGSVEKLDQGYDDWKGLRGGGWNDYGRSLITSIRAFAPESELQDHAGFRCACSGKIWNSHP